MPALALILLGLMACTSMDVSRRRDWAAMDALVREARWRVEHCSEPSSEKCDALFLVREEIGAILKAQREALEQGRQ